MIPGVICRIICDNMLTAISSYYRKDYWSENITSWNVVHENRFLCFIGKLLQYYMDNDDISIMVETTTATFVLFQKVYKENQSPYFNSSITRHTLRSRIKKAVLIWYGIINTSTNSCNNIVGAWLSTKEEVRSKEENVLL